MNFLMNILGFICILSFVLVINLSILLSFDIINVSINTIIYVGLCCVNSAIILGVIGEVVVNGE